MRIVRHRYIERIDPNRCKNEWYLSKDVDGRPDADDLWIQRLRRHDERVYSFVDATSFAVMRQLGITEALAFDGDFSAAGFIEVRP